jgi:hypothetical protein
MQYLINRRLRVAFKPNRFPRGVWMATILAQGRSRLAAFTAILAVALIPLLSTPVVPSIDFYHHLARYYVLARLGDSAFLGQNFQAAWTLVPDLGLDVVGVGVLHFLPPRPAAQILLGLIFVIQFTGVLAFNRQVAGRASLVVAILIVPLLYSFILRWGFTNFLLGLGLAFWGAALWLKRRDRLQFAIPLGCVFGLATFLCHGVAFGLYGLTLGAIEVGIFLTARPLDWRSLAAHLAGLAIQAILPVLLFMLSPIAKVQGGLTSADEVVRKLAPSGGLAAKIHDVALYRLATILRVSESGSYLFDALTLMAVVVVLLALMARGWIRIPSKVWPALLLGAVLVALMPPTVFAVSYIADRMPLYFAFLCIGSIQATREAFGIDRAMIASLLVLSAARVGAIAADWRATANDFADFNAIAKQLPARQLVGFYNRDDGKRLLERRRCEMYGPLMVTQLDQASYIFAFQTQQPIRLAGQLAEASLAQSIDRGSQSRQREGELDGMISRGLYNYVLTCDVPPFQPRQGARIAAVGRFALYRTADVMKRVPMGAAAIQAAGRIQR